MVGIGSFQEKKRMPAWNALPKPFNIYAFSGYYNLYYGSPYEMHSDQKETCSIYATNADLRHYLKRMACKIRCLSRRLATYSKIYNFSPIFTTNVR